MGLRLPILLVLSLLGACASTPKLGDAERLALHQAHAGAPVSSFRMFGQLDGWSPLGDDAMVVWTRPREAWLLDLVAPCPDLRYATALALTSFGNVVHARSDSVTPLGPMVGQVGRVPCRIAQIRPLDTAALKQAQEQLRQIQAAEREAQAPTP
jgi:hypothetical protein